MRKHHTFTLADTVTGTGVRFRNRFGIEPAGGRYAPGNAAG